MWITSVFRSRRWPHLPLLFKRASFQGSAWSSWSSFILYSEVGQTTMLHGHSTRNYSCSTTSWSLSPTSTTWSSSYRETVTAWYTALPCSLFSSSKALLADPQNNTQDHSPIIIEHVHKISDVFLRFHPQKVRFWFLSFPMFLWFSMRFFPGGHPNPPTCRGSEVWCLVAPRIVERLLWAAAKCLGWPGVTWDFC